jgi:hypothetical protein
VAQGFLGGLGANTGMNSVVLGNEVMLRYGSKLIALRGARPIVNHVANLNSVAGQVSKAAAIALGLAFTGSVLNGALQAFDQSQEAWKLALGIIGGVTGALAIADSAWAYADTAAGVANAGSAAIVGASPAVLARLAELAKGMAKPQPDQLNDIQVIAGTFATLAEGVIQGAKDSLMLYAGTDTRQQSALTMGKDKIVLALGDPVIGPRLELSLGGAMIPPSITLKVGGANGATIQMTQWQITIAVGQTVKVTLTTDRLTISTLRYSLQVGANAQQNFADLTETIIGKVVRSAQVGAWQ